MKTLLSSSKFFIDDPFFLPVEQTFLSVFCSDISSKKMGPFIAKIMLLRVMGWLVPSVAGKMLSQEDGGLSYGGPDGI